MASLKVIWHNETPL